jgi:sulfofructose kinase
MARILVVGVAVIDFVLYVDKFPETPEKYRANDGAIVGGGNAANAACSIVKLGGEAHLAARLGGDQIADLVRQSVSSIGVDVSPSRIFEHCRGSFSSVLVDGQGERMIVNFRDSNLPVDPRWLDEIDIKQFDAVLADTRWPEGAERAMQLARNASIPGVLDAEAPTEGCIGAYRAASHVAFAEQGLADFNGGDVISAQKEIGDFVCVTRGQHGVDYASPEGAGHADAPSVIALETLGAGDVWHAAFTLALAEGHNESHAVNWASLAGSLKCRRAGGRDSYPTRQELEAFQQEIGREH